MSDFAPHGFISFQLARREELRRWAAGDPLAEGPATGLQDDRLWPSERTISRNGFQNFPEGGGGRVPYAGKDDERTK